MKPIARLGDGGSRLGATVDGGKANVAGENNLKCSTNPIWTALESNPGHCNDKPVSFRRSYGLAQVFTELHL